MKRARFRTEIDANLKPEIKAISELLRNTIIALLAVLVVLVVSAVYVWHQRRRRQPAE